MTRDPTDGSGRIRAVLFDLGGTLVEDRDFDAFVTIAEQLDLRAHPEDLGEAVRWATSEFDRPDAIVSPLDFWKAALSRASESEVAPSVVRQFVERLTRLPKVPHLFSDVRRCLERLRADGRLLGVISNSRSESGIRETLERTGILGFFSALVSSGSEGIAKPNPEIFRRGATRLGVPVGEAFYVGDLAYTDVKAAQAAGLRAVWLNRDGDGLGDDPPEITSLSELPKLVRRLETALVK